MSFLFDVPLMTSMLGEPWLTAFDLVSLDTACVAKEDRFQFSEMVQCVGVAFGENDLYKCEPKKTTAFCEWLQTRRIFHLNRKFTLNKFDLNRFPLLMSHIRHLKIDDTLNVTTTCGTEIDLSSAHTIEVLEVMSRRRLQIKPPSTSFLHLQKIVLKECQVTRTFFVMINCYCPHLTDLSLQWSTVSSDVNTTSDFLNVLQKLEKLQLGFNIFSPFDFIPDVLENLQELRIDSSVSEDELQGLSKVPSLKLLRLKIHNHLFSGNMDRIVDLLALYTPACENLIMDIVDPPPTKKNSRQPSSDDKSIKTQSTCRVTELTLNNVNYFSVNHIVPNMECVRIVNLNNVKSISSFDMRCFMNLWPQLKQLNVQYEHIMCGKITALKSIDTMRTLFAQQGVELNAEITKYL